MHADFTLEPDGSVVIPGHGGKREGSGRPKGYSPKSRTTDPDQPPDEPTVAQRFHEARARKEAALADQAEHKFEVESGNYLARDAYRQASATLLAEVAQTLRSLPDLLERKCGLAPDAVVRVEQEVDAALNSLSAGLEMFCEQVPGQ